MSANKRLDIPLYRLGHSRSGDKGDTSNISLIAWNQACYDGLCEHVTADSVNAWFAYRRHKNVSRYLLPGLHAMNFVLDSVLDSSVNDALNLDTHGKGLSFRPLDMMVSLDAIIVD